MNSKKHVALTFQISYVTAEELRNQKQFAELTNCVNTNSSRVWFEKGRRKTRSSSAIETKQFPPNLIVFVQNQTR